MSRCLIGIVLLVLVSGCTSFVIEPYGFVALDREPVLPHLQRVNIPAEAPSISQGYSPEPKTENYDPQESYHEGIDIIDGAGTPVLAPAPGKVIVAYFEPFYGRRIVIDHGQNKDGLYMRSRYLHLQTRLVSEGDHVKRGQAIGTMGRSGLLSGGMSHLHFEIRSATRQDQKYYDSMHPHRFWYDGVGNITCFDRSRVYSDTPFRITYPVPCKKNNNTM